EQSNIKVINQKCIYWRNLKVENCKYYDENLKEKIEDIFLKQNDILINSTGTGTLGRCVKFNKIDNSEYIADSHVTVLRSISNNLNSDYFAALFEFTNIQDTIYRKCVNGSTNQIELSVSKLGEYLIMVPPIEFQNQFSEFVKQVDKLKLKIETNLKELEDNFNSLMQKAFKGELFN
ncbi:restriction endonuclease subunit S, partial [Clostridioides difficile]